MSKYLVVVFILLIFSCQEEITPILRKTPDTSGGTGSPGTNPNEAPVAGKYAECLSVLSNTTLDIVTWNIEQFPKESGNTITLLTELIKAMDADIIGVQEISSSGDFATLMGNLTGYSSKLYTGSLKQGFIYKTSEITNITEITPLFTDDSYAFTRPALMVTATHTSGKEVTVINLHLKCCDDGTSIDRRLQASIKLKAYMDANLTNKSVVVLGDFNEDITQPEGNNVFQNFVTDNANYKFADMGIAQGGSAYWSYPSWPSHLDHMLITNELFDDVYSIKTVEFQKCDGSYYNLVSDHRPVLMRLETN